MTQTDSRLPALVDRILATPPRGRRRLVALAGGPASGKSTLAAALARALNSAGAQAQVVPMDGFHLDNALLIARTLLERKGAPQTFDAAGFVHLVRRVRDEAEVVFPTFDRTRDLAVAGAGQITQACDTAIVEGNYLLFDAPQWRDIARLWDVSIRLDPPRDVLRARLVARWVAHGLDAEQARARAELNDLPNAQTVADAALPADITLQTF